MRLRKQALDQLVIPEDQSSITCQADPTALSGNTPSQFHVDPIPIDHCMALDDCFIPSESEDVCGCNSGTPFDYSGELPLPPSAHAHVGRVEERGRAEVSLKKVKEEKRGLEKPPQSTEEIEEIEEISETSPAVLSSELHTPSFMHGNTLRIAQ